jgi:hypothetical protein
MIHQIRRLYKMNHTKNRVVILSALVAALISSVAKAAAYPGTGVAGHCFLTEGLMAAPANVQESETAIMSTLQNAAKALHAGQLQQIAAQKNLLNQQTQATVAFLKNLYAAQSAAQYESNTSTPNQPVNVCNEPKISANLASGEQSRRTLDQAMQLNFKKWSAGTSSQYAANLALSKLTNPETSATSLFEPDPTKATVSSDANTYISVLAAPKRPLITTPDQEKTAAGLRQKVEKEGWQLQTSYAANALTYISTLHQPVISGSDFVDQWQQSGQSGNPPEYNTALKTISPDGALSTQVRARYASPDWYQHLGSEGQSGALREITQMAAIELKQEEISLNLAEQLASVSAVSYSQSIAKPNRDQLGIDAGTTADQSVRKN